MMDDETFAFIGFRLLLSTKIPTQNVLIQFGEANIIFSFPISVL